MIDVPADVNVEAVYPIAALAGAPDPAREFVAYVLGPRAGDARAAGFLAP